MKVVTWKELFEFKGDVVWAIYDEFDFPETVNVQYNSGIKRVCEEPFPILKPDYEDCTNYSLTLDKFNQVLIGKVSELETSSDTYDCYPEDMKVIIYDKEDVQSWINKLQSLNINY